MKNNYYLKAIFLILINSLFLFQDTKSFKIENEIKGVTNFTKKTFKEFEINSKNENFFNKNRINPLSIFLAFENKNNTRNDNNSNDKNKFLIESDEQIESKDSFILKGNVIIKFNGAILKTDFIKYSKVNNTIVSEGNIQYLNNNQFLKADKFTYDIAKKTGVIQNVYGLIDIVTLSKDLNWESSNFYKKTDISSEITKTRFESENIIGLSIEQEKSDDDSLKSAEAKISINSLKKWRFQSPEVFVNDQLLSAKRASFTNDPYTPAQLILESYNLKSKRKKGKLILISSWTNLNLDNKVTIPLARRTIKEDQDSLQKWGIGIDYEEKDGFYLSRNSDQFEINNFKSKFVSEIYLQRIFEDKTSVFREKDSSITSEVVENKINTGDYFGFKFLTNSNIVGYEFDTLTSLNSLNTDRLSESVRHEAYLERVFDFENIKNINNNIFYVFRNKIDTGFEGIKEIYSGLGTNFEKSYNFNVNNLDFYSSLRFQLANFKSEELNSINLISKNRFSTEGFLENRYNIWNKKNQNQYIDKTYKYTPKILNKGLDWVTKLTLTSSFYENHNNQNIIKLEFGPELQLGEFKKDWFDNTNFKVLLGLFEKSGDSPFNFDNVNESERIYFELNQQIFGPVILGAEAHLNIDKNSSEFNNFINPKYILSINRRAYNIEIYTVPDRGITGVSFNIFGLGYDGYGSRFKDSF